MPTSKPKAGASPVFKSIRLKNFKAYRDSGEVPLAPLTIILGTNNSGKSSLFQAILVLAQTLDDPSRRPALVTSGQMVELNGFFDILHRNSSNQLFEISLTLNPNVAQFLRSNYSYGDVDRVLANRLDVSFKLADKEIEVHKSTLWAGDKRIIEVGDDLQGTSEIFNVTDSDKLICRLENFLPAVGWETTEARQDLVRKFGIDARISLNIWQYALSHVSRAGPVRLRVPWYSGVGTTSPSGFGLGGANLIAELGSLTPSTEGRILVNEVNSWLSGKLGLPNRLRVQNVDRAGNIRSLVGDEKGGAKNINAAAMGEGVSQVLPIISRALAGPAVECLFIEQPEIHLHPSLQADLADLFIGVTQPGYRQVILETHSEHLLWRIRRRVAEGLPTDGLAILYVHRKGSESVVKKLELNGQGHFDDWPKGFFDQAYLDAMAMVHPNTTARSRRE